MTYSSQAAREKLPRKRPFERPHGLVTDRYRAFRVDRATVGPERDHAFTAAVKSPLALQIAPFPNPVVFGSPLRVEGRLAGISRANGERHYEVLLEADPFPYRTGFRPLGEPELTNAAGEFSFTVANLLETSQLRVVTPGRSQVVAPVVNEGVAARVSFHVAATRRRGYVRLYGTVAPRQVRGLVGFERIQPDGSAVNEGGTVLRSAHSGAASFARVVRVPPGPYRALVQVSSGAYLSAYSSAVIVR
jgi:hypothetical protein